MSILSFGYFKLARNIAKESDYHVKVGAVIAKKKPISAMSNCSKSHPKCFDGFMRSTHAEVRAITNCGAENLEGASIYVFRATADGKPALSKPCSNCLTRIKEYGIKRVYYSIDENSYGVIRL